MRARSVAAGSSGSCADLWPGAGWGVVDANGAPKPAWYALRRALQPIALAITDEGTNGLALHVANDRATILDATLEVTLWRAGDVQVGRGAIAIAVPSHGALEVPAASLFDGFMDLSFAYRFGPAIAHVIHATLEAGGVRIADAFWLPAGLPATRELEVGLAAHAHVRADHLELVASYKRFAQSVSIDLVGLRRRRRRLSPRVFPVRVGRSCCARQAAGRHGGSRRAVS